MNLDTLKLEQTATVTHIDTVYITVDNQGLELEYSQFVANLIKKFDDRRLEICHAAMGVSGEAGELCDALKRDAIYGKVPDIKNITEELGDLEFFMEDIRTKYGITRQQVLQANADKLGERYVGLIYTDTAAIARADKLEHSGVVISAEGNTLTEENVICAAVDKMRAIIETPKMPFEEQSAETKDVHNWGLTKEQQGSN